MSQDLMRQFAGATRFDTEKKQPSEVRSTPLLSSPAPGSLFKQPEAPETW